VFSRRCFPSFYYQPEFTKHVQVCAPELSQNQIHLIIYLDIVVIMLLDNIIVFVQQQKKGCLILWWPMC
jgi:hypothetical protein